MARFRYDFVSGVSWITTGDGERVQYVVGRMLDWYQERVRQSTLARMVLSTVNTDSIGLVASGQTLVRGISETDAGFTQRSVEWLEPWSLRTKGGYYALLKQCATVLGLPATTRIKAVGRNGFWVQYQDDVITYGTLSNGFWVDVGAPSLLAALWSWVYIVIENHPSWASSSSLVGDPGLWGDAIGATDEVIGIAGARYQEIADLRTTVREWLPPSAVPVELLFNAAPGSPFPETGVDTGTPDAPNYTTLVPTDLVRIAL